MDLNIASIDLDVAEEGQWIEYESGIEFLIARAGNPKYNAGLQRFYRKHRRAIDEKTMANSVADAAMAELMAKHILLGWRGLKDGGAPLEYSQDAAEAMLSDERYGELRKWITDQSQNEENYRAEYLKA